MKNNLKKLNKLLNKLIKNNKVKVQMIQNHKNNKKSLNHNYDYIYLLIFINFIIMKLQIIIHIYFFI